MGSTESQQGGEKMEHLTSTIKHTEMGLHRMGKCRHLPLWGAGGTTENMSNDPRMCARLNWQARAHASACSHPRVRGGVNASAVVHLRTFYARTHRETQRWAVF